jgi:hypothetical protein
MNWYKKAQNQLNFSTWLSDELKRLTNNYQSSPSSSIIPTPESLQKNIKDVQRWVAETNPDLSNYNLARSIEEARRYLSNKKYMSVSEEMEANRNAFISEHQNLYPQADNFAVDMMAKKQSLPATIKNRINKSIYNILLNKHFESIPLKEIMDACEAQDVIVLQEDGTKWGGFLTGGAECGSKEAESQHALFELAYKKDDAYYITKNALSMTWCTMHSGKYEIVAYVS